MPGGVFATTQWSVVVAAGDASSPESQAALEALCRAYWPPVYAYVRRRGYGIHDAQDLTQEFFRRLLASDWIARADRTKGRFRSFLLAGVQNFLANEWQKNARLKRGAGLDIIPLDAFATEERHTFEPATEPSADKIFDRRWALTLLQRVLDQLQAEQAGEGDSRRFEALRPVLLGQLDPQGYAALAQRFAVTESAIKSWVQRFRQRYRQLLRQEVAQTVGSAEEVEDELRYLLRIVAG
jgi:RNA polymerase sigma-70 factor (ECF subfamily)